MEYSNGRPAQKGDTVFWKDYNGNPLSGVVVATGPGVGVGNLTVLPIDPFGMMALPAKDLLHTDDIQPKPYEPPAKPAPLIPLTPLADNPDYQVAAAEAKGEDSIPVAPAVPGPVE